MPDERVAWKTAQKSRRFGAAGFFWFIDAARPAY
jgi:hypothetical protein